MGRDGDRETQGKRIVGPIATQTRVKDRTEQPYPGQNRRSRAGRDRCADHRLAQRLGQVERTELVAVQLQDNAARRVKQRRLHEMVKDAAARGKPEPGIGGQLRNLLRCGRHEQPMRITHVLRVGKIPERLRSVVDGVESDRNHREAVVSQRASRDAHCQSQLARRCRADAGAARVNHADHDRAPTECVEADRLACAGHELHVADGAPDRGLAFPHRARLVERPDRCSRHDPAEGGSSQEREPEHDDLALQPSGDDAISDGSDQQQRQLHERGPEAAHGPPARRIEAQSHGRRQEP